MRTLPLLLLAGCAGAAPAPERPEPPPEPAPLCETLTEEPDTATRIQEAVVSCALVHLRDGLRIEGTVDVRAELNTEGGASEVTLEVTPTEARGSMRECLEESLWGPPCSTGSGSFALSSEIELPHQDRPTVELGRDSARVVEPGGEGALAVLIETTGGVTESMARGALSIDVHRITETCFLRAAEAALRGDAPMDVSVPLTLQIVWQPGQAPRTSVARSPSAELTGCFTELLGNAVRTPAGLESTGTARCEMPTRRYLHPSVEAMLREDG
ncbi:MAG: hypothetical protein JJ863_25160 [Deltaproteobacteria bacterium]|nr:hypothetical protein [Deltaproteobacteria bacterium]